MCLIEAARWETAPRKAGTLPDSDVIVYIREQRGSLCQMEAPEGGDVLRVSGPQFPYMHNGKREGKGFIHRKLLQTFSTGQGRRRALSPGTGPRAQADLHL